MNPDSELIARALLAEQADRQRVMWGRWFSVQNTHLFTAEAAHKAFADLKRRQAEEAK